MSSVENQAFFSPFVSFTYSVFLFLFIFGKSTSEDTLQAARKVSTSQYKCTGSAKLHQLKSVHKQSVKLPILSFKDFIQCHLCTTKTPRYYYISFVLFYKRTTWCTPILWVSERVKSFPPLFVPSLVTDAFHLPKIKEVSSSRPCVSFGVVFQQWVSLVTCSCEIKEK